MKSFLQIIFYSAILPFSFSSISNASLADYSGYFNGRWSGMAEISSLSYELKCSNIDIKIIHNKLKQELLIYMSYLCPYQTVLYPYTILFIQADGALLLNGKKVGSMTLNQIHITRRNGPYNLWLTLDSDNQLIIKELLASRVDFTMIDGVLNTSVTN